MNNLTTTSVHMNILPVKTSCEKSARDGRFTVIILIGLFFLVFFFISGLIPGNTILVDEQTYNLEIEMISLYEKSLPANLTPFFFKKLPVNIADKTLLMTIKGVGPRLAESIIQARLDYGPFKSGNDLLRIKGVGKKRASYFQTVFDFDGEK